MMVKSMGWTTESYYTLSTTARPPMYPDETTYPTYTSTASYPLDSSTTDYPTESSTQRYPYDTNYSTYRTTLASTTEDFFWTPTSSPYPSWAWSSPSITVEPFTTIYVSLARNVVLRSTSTPTDYAVEFKCDMNMINYVSTNVTNVALTINSPADCDVIIHAYEFQIIQIGYVRSLTTSDNLQGNQLAIRTDGASRITLNNIAYSVVEVLLLSSSNVTLSGFAHRLDVIQLGRGTFDARSLSTDQATVITYNSGLVRIKSNNDLSLTVEGLGDIIWCSPHGDINMKGEIYYTPRNVVYYCD